MQPTQAFPLRYRKFIATMLALYLLLGSAVPAITADDHDVQALYRLCKMPIETQEFAICVGFVSGVGETMGVLQFGIRKLPDFGAFSICDAPPHGAMVQAFADWAEKNPQEWKNPAILGVMTALRETWPCDPN
jgi:Rap1a immunity proteins